MNTQRQLNQNLNDITSTPVEKNPNPVNILPFLEIGNLQKCFFSGQITLEEYQKRKRILKISNAFIRCSAARL